MSFGDTFAFCALMIAVIAFSGILLEGYKRRLTNREIERELEVRRLEALASGGGRISEDVEQRLRVLEAIATDPAHALSRRIEALREEAAA